jgi:predicted thioesterase
MEGMLFSRKTWPSILKEPFTGQTVGKGGMGMLNISDHLSVGLSHDVTITVSEEEAVGNFSPRLGQLLATSACTRAFIRAAIESTDSHLPDGYITVGQSIDITHEAPSFLGTMVTFKATLVRIEGNKLTYELSAHDHAGTVAKGQHVRAVVNWELLMNEARERAYSKDRGV